MNMLRRTFLKAGTALGAGKLLTLYTEPLSEIVVPKKHEWIEDKGDFYIVRVPDYKTFAGECLNRNTIFLVGVGATVHQVSVTGYANVLLNHQSRMHQVHIDASDCLVAGRNCVVLVDAINSQNKCLIEQLTAIGPQVARDEDKIPYGLRVELGQEQDHFGKLLTIKSDDFGA